MAPSLSRLIVMGRGWYFQSTNFLFFYFKFSFWIMPPPLPLRVEFHIINHINVLNINNNHLLQHPQQPLQHHNNNNYFNYRFDSWMFMDKAKRCCRIFKTTWRRNLTTHGRSFEGLIINQLQHPQQQPQQQPLQQLQESLQHHNIHTTTTTIVCNFKLLLKYHQNRLI